MIRTVAGSTVVGVCLVGVARAPPRTWSRRWTRDAVFALGDLQYQAGSLANFGASYDRSWGRFKGITYPVPGHQYGDPGAGGLFRLLRCPGDAAGPGLWGGLSGLLQLRHRQLACGGLERQLWQTAGG